MKKWILAASLLLGITGISFAQTTVAKTPVTKHASKKVITTKNTSSTTPVKVMVPLTTNNSNAGAVTNDKTGKVKPKHKAVKKRSTRQTSPMNKKDTKDNNKNPKKG